MENHKGNAKRNAAIQSIVFLVTFKWNAKRKLYIKEKKVKYKIIKLYIF